MNDILDLLLGGLHYIYGERWVAPFVLLPIMLVIALIVHLVALSSARPYLAATKNRILALQDALGDNDDPVIERKHFAENYISLSRAMGADEKGSRSLILAWREFQESMVDEDTNPIRNTNLPGTFFNRAAPKFTTLTFASNIFVGAGLILTFLGLIVALNTAAQGMSGGDVNVAKQSLQGLLVVAGAKFFTSVAGLGASIYLRFAEHSLSGRVRRQTKQICELLERGLLYVSPQRLAVEQLEVMREQRDQLKFFNTDVALQLSERIGHQFTAAIAPVSASLDRLNENMNSVTQGIGAGAKEAIEKVSGDQLRGLSDTLAGLSNQLDKISETVGGSSEDAARQIRDAGEDFARAASDIREAFGRLTAQVDTMGHRLNEQGEAAKTAQQKALADIMEGIGAAQERSNDMVAEVIATLKSAGAEAAGSMQNGVREVLKEGVEASQKTFKIAIEESGEALRASAHSLTSAVGEAAKQVERANLGFAQTGDRAAQTAEAMRSVTNNARSVASSLDDAAKGFATAAGPVSEAARAVNQAATRISQTIETDRAADAQAISEMKSLAQSVRATQEAAEEAWANYRQRFEGVDRALSEATNKLAETLGDSLTKFREFAQETDKEMASAVSRLGLTMTQIEEYAESLDDYVEELRGLREPAE